MFDSPFEFCALCREYVLLDQTQKQCAREYACAPATLCPLDRFFTGIDFAAGKHAAEGAGRRPGSRSGTR